MDDRRTSEARNVDDHVLQFQVRMVQLIFEVAVTAAIAVVVHLRSFNTRIQIHMKRTPKTMKGSIIHCISYAVQRIILVAIPKS